MYNMKMRLIILLLLFCTHILADNVKVFVAIYLLYRNYTYTYKDIYNQTDNLTALSYKDASVAYSEFR